MAEDLWKLLLQEGFAEDSIPWADIKRLGGANMVANESQLQEWVKRASWALPSSIPKPWPEGREELDKVDPDSSPCTTSWCRLFSQAVCGEDGEMKDVRDPARFYKGRKQHTLFPHKRYKNANGMKVLPPSAFSTNFSVAIFSNPIPFLNCTN